MQEKKISVKQYKQFVKVSFPHELNPLCNSVSVASFPGLPASLFAWLPNEAGRPGDKAVCLYIISHLLIHATPTRNIGFNAEEVYISLAEVRSQEKTRRQ